MFNSLRYSHQQSAWWCSDSVHPSPPSSCSGWSLPCPLDWDLLASLLPHGLLLVTLIQSALCSPEHDNNFMIIQSMMENNSHCIVIVSPHARTFPRHTERSHYTDLWLWSLQRGMCQAECPHAAQPDGRKSYTGVQTHCASLCTHTQSPF